MYIQIDNHKNLGMKIIFCWHLEGQLTKRAGSVRQMYGSEDPDPYQNVADPDIYTAIPYIINSQIIHTHV